VKGQQGKRAGRQRKKQRGLTVAAWLLCLAPRQLFLPPRQPFLLFSSLLMSSRNKNRIARMMTTAQQLAEWKAQEERRARTFAERAATAAKEKQDAANHAQNMGWRKSTTRAAVLKVDLTACCCLLLLAAACCCLLLLAPLHTNIAFHSFTATRSDVLFFCAFAGCRRG
jgi:hypothetical protein